MLFKCSLHRKIRSVTNFAHRVRVVSKMRSISFQCLALTALSFVLAVPIVDAQSDYPYSYTCVDNKCTKVFTTGSAGETTLNKCKLNCGQGGTLWPLPTGPVTLSPDFSNFRPIHATFVQSLASGGLEVRDMLNEATRIFGRYLDSMTPTAPTSSAEGGSPNANLQLRVTLRVERSEATLGLNTDESYKLEINTKTDQINVTISGATYFGVRHGLETLSQLVTYDDVASNADGVVVFAVVANANIEDKPVYPYRGLMLDTSRNFAPVSRIRKLIDGLSYNKLNIFHWHITDSHSFPMQVTGQPNMTKFGAYSPDKTYSVQEMADLVAYAKVRGVKIVPELDAPAHAGNGWVWEEGHEDLAVCVNKDPWYNYCIQTPCGQLNIASNRMYEVLGDVYRSMMNIFDNDIFHMGGDEVDLRCYNTSQVITDFMGTNRWARDHAGFMELWDHFQRRAYDQWTRAIPDPVPPNRLAILWTSELTNPEYITKYLERSKYAIQIWTNGDDSIVPFLINNKYRVIFSNVNAWYLDCGFHNWGGNSGHNWCSPYKTWQQVYENSPYKLYAAASSEAEAEVALAEGLLLGGVAPLWTEQADEESMESRFWPRGSALAERLWSDPRTTGVAEAVTRIVQNRQRNVERGIQADRLQPEWCLQNEGKCVSDRPPPVTTTTTPAPVTTTTTPIIITQPTTPITTPTTTPLTTTPLTTTPTVTPTTTPTVTPTTTPTVTPTTTPTVTTTPPAGNAMTVHLGISLLIVEAIVLLF